MSSRFVGIDVGTESIEVVVRPTGETFAVGDVGDDAVGRIIDKLKHINPDIVVMLASGKQELPVARDLVAAGIQCAFVPPLQVREFAHAIGRFRSIESGRAELLARFAELVRPQEYTVGVDQIRQLRELKRRRGELTAMIDTERARMDEASPAVRKNIREHIDFLRKAVRRVDEEANFAVRSSAAWR